MATLSFLLCTLLTFSLSFYVISATVNYVVTIEPPNHPGSIKFNKVIGGIPYTKQVMGKTNNFIWSTIFKQNTPADRKPVNTVQVIIKDFTGAEAITWDTNKINVSVVYLNEYKGDLKWEFTSLLYHEMTHVFQWQGGDKVPVKLLEGIADYTILKANYFPPRFAKPGQGDTWDQGYDFTARFLEYCDGLVPGFVAKLNNMMRKSYDVSFFQKLAGKPVDQLWKEYKAKYGGKKGIEG